MPFPAQTPTDAQARLKADSNLLAQHLQPPWARACSVCDHPHTSQPEAKDFGVSGSDPFEGRRVFADHGVGIGYQQCLGCGFTFTSAFDAWTPDEWRAHVYNHDYALADPPFLRERPERNAQMLAALFHRELPKLRVLDIGGGQGRLAEALRQAGAQAHTMDPFHDAHSHKPDGVYELITSFEVIEHVPHQGQHAWMQEAARHLSHQPCARMLIGTELRQAQHSLDWWYICPRNGHVSIHTEQSLGILAAQAGLKLTSINPSMHLLMRDAT